MAGLFCFTPTSAQSLDASLLRFQMGSEYTARELSNPRPACIALAKSVCNPNDIRQGFTRTYVDIKGRPRI